MKGGLHPKSIVPMEGGIGFSGGLAGVTHEVDAASPGFYKGAAKKGVGDARIVGRRSVFGGKLFNRPVMGQLAGIPDHEFIVIDADLNGVGRGVVLVSDGVEIREHNTTYLLNMKSDVKIARMSKY